MSSKEVLGVLNIFSPERESGLLEKEFMYEVARSLAENLALFHNRKVAREDYLTKLESRREFIADLKTAIREAENEKIYLAMLDVDDFSKVNANHGHLGGDYALTGLGRMLNALKGIDHGALVTSTGRYGGEEIGILIEGGDEKTACDIVDKLRRNVANNGFGESGINGTFTAGVSEYSPGMTIKDLIDRADRALYAGKNSGKNKVCFFDNKEEKIMKYDAGGYLYAVNA